MVKKLALTVAILGLFIGSISGHPHRSRLSIATSNLLAPAPSPVSMGGSIATVMSLVGAPVDSVFALRGGDTPDFWHYSISQNEWTRLPDAPAPVSDGGGIVEVASSDFCKPGRFFIAALRGANTPDFSEFNIDENRWCAGPPTPAPVGPGGAIAQLQQNGQIYALRGNGTTDFWSFSNNQWKVLTRTPGPVGAGGGLVGINYGSSSDVLYALQGGGSRAVWRYDVGANTWSPESEAPASIGPGGAISSPNFGAEGTLVVLQGGESPAVWSLDISSGVWTLLENAPDIVTSGGAASSQFNGCDFAFVGGGSTRFFATSRRPCLGDDARFSLALDQSTVAAERGTKLKIKLSIVRSGDFAGNINIIPPPTAPQGIRLPEGVIPISGDNLIFKIKIKGNAAMGTDELVFTGMDDAGRRRSTTLTLIVR